MKSTLTITMVIIMIAELSGQTSHRIPGANAESEIQRKKIEALKRTQRPDNLVLGIQNKPDGPTYGEQNFIVDDAFKYLEEDPEYYCHGKPSANTQYVRCRLCGEEYKLQRFKFRDKPEEIFISESIEGCKSNYSRTGHHDSRTVKPINKCGCRPDVRIIYDN